MSRDLREARDRDRARRVVEGTDDSPLEDVRASECERHASRQAHLFDLGATGGGAPLILSETP